MSFTVNVSGDWHRPLRRRRVWILDDVLAHHLARFQDHHAERNADDDNDEKSEGS
jgi:hypothetical protein